MTTNHLLRICTALGAYALLAATPGCVVEPFGHEGDGGRGRHDEHRSMDRLLPAPGALPLEDAGDGIESGSARLAPAGSPIRTIS